MWGGGHPPFSAGHEGKLQGTLDLCLLEGKHGRMGSDLCHEIQGSAKKGGGLSRNTGQVTIVHEQDVVLDVGRLGEPAGVYSDTLPVNHLGRDGTPMESHVTSCS